MAAIEPDHILYFSIDKTQLDEDGSVKTEALRLPDFSCNWDQFSIPDDVRYRRNGRLTDGCAAIRAEDVSAAIKLEEIDYGQFAAPVHDPLCDEVPNNYSHVEVRQISPDSPPNEEPRRGYKGAKQKRNAWRRHICNKLRIIIEPSA